MSGEPVYFRIVLDHAGDPRTLDLVMPRCPACGRMARGDVVKVPREAGVDFYHASCWGSRARTRLQ